MEHASTGGAEGSPLLGRGEPADATLYVHCGGLEGLGTSLKRYERAGLLRAGEDAAAALATARQHAAHETGGR